MLGRITGVFGVRGWVRVYSYTRPPEALIDYRGLLLRVGDSWSAVRIAEGGRRGKGIILRLKGVEDRDAAGALVDADIGIDRTSLPEPEEGSYYWADLEGLQVERVDGSLVGTVDHLLETGANDVLVVTGDRDTLIPFVPESVIKDVDLENGRIVVDWEWD